MRDNRKNMQTGEKLLHTIWHISILLTYCYWRFCCKMTVVKKKQIWWDLLCPEKIRGLKCMGFNRKKRPNIKNNISLERCISQLLRSNNCIIIQYKSRVYKNIKNFSSILQFSNCVNRVVFIFTHIIFQNNFFHSQL